jgi:Replication-relaxation
VHLVGVNSFFAGLASSARTRPDAALAAWWSERRCAQRWGRLVRPDGFGRWTAGGRTVEFFLEYDTGSETVARVVHKLNGYTDLATLSGIWTPTLFWLPSPSREAEIRRAIGTPWSRSPRPPGRSATPPPRHGSPSARGRAATVSGWPSSAAAPTGNPAASAARVPSSRVDQMARLDIRQSE